MKIPNFVGSLAITSISTFIAMLLGAVTTKIVAVSAGPVGIAVFSQMRQSGQVLTLFATLNGQNSLIRGIASRSADQRNSFARLIGGVFLLGGLIVCLTTALLASRIGELIFPTGGRELREMVFLLALLAPLGAMASYYFGVLNGLRLIKPLAIAQLGAALASTVVAYPFVHFSHPSWYVAIVATGFITSIILSTRALSKSGWILLGFLPPIQQTATTLETGALRQHLQIAIANLLTGLSGSMALVGIRTLYIHEGGFLLGGILDAAWTISSMYVMLLLSSFSTHYLPLLSGAISIYDLKQNVRFFFRIVTIFSVPLVCTAVLLKPYLIGILYSKEFSPAVDLLRWMIVGDYLKITSWVFGMLLIARARTMIFLISELISQSSLVCTIWLFLSKTSEVVGIAYLLNNIVYLIFVWRFAKREYGIQIDPRSLFVWTVGLFMVFLLSLLGWRDRLSPSVALSFGYAICLPTVLFLASTREERRSLILHLRSMIASAR